MGLLCSAMARGCPDGVAGRAAGALQAAAVSLALRRRAAHFRHAPNRGVARGAPRGGLMSMIRLFALIALLSSAVPGPASGQESSDPEVAPVRSVLSGVYTAAQATRGEAQFKQNCAACHTTGEFSSVAFRRAWSGRTIYDLFEMVRTLMPYDSPG